MRRPLTLILNLPKCQDFLLPSPCLPDSLKIWSRFGQPSQWIKSLLHSRCHMYVHTRAYHKFIKLRTDMFGLALRVNVNHESFQLNSTKRQNKMYGRFCKLFYCKFPHHARAAWQKASMEHEKTVFKPHCTVCFSVFTRPLPGCARQVTSHNLLILSWQELASWCITQMGVILLSSMPTSGHVQGFLAAPTHTVACRRDYVHH